MVDGGPTSIDPVATSAGPARVERAIEVRERGIIALFTVTTTAEAPVRVSVVDYFPGNWRVDEIGFHEAYRPDEGSASTDVLRFDVTVPPGEETLVVSGITLDSAVDREAVEAAQSFSTPRIERVDPVSAGEPALDEEPASGDQDDIFDQIGGATVERDESAVEPGVSGRQLADALAAAVRAGNVDEATIDTLRGALVDRDGTSTQLRLERLESRQAEFATYVDALRDLIEEHGPATEFVAQLQASIRELEDETAALQDDIEATRGASASIREELTSRTDDLGDRLDAVEEANESLGAGIAVLASDLDDLRSRVQELEDEIEGAGTEIDDLSADLDDVNRTTAAIESQVATIADELDALRNRVEEWEAVRERLLDALEPELRFEPEPDERADR